MLFKYKILDNKGSSKEGIIETVSKDSAINSLQNKGFVVVSVEPAEKTSVFNINLFERVSNKDIVILSRQIATLFQAQVSILRIFRLLSDESENPVLGKKLGIIANDLQGGSSISQALTKHPKVFSDFYVNMVRAGEESGKLSDTFLYLADYLDKSFDLASKAKSALVYPAFVVVVFIVVMILMFTMVIPKISAVLVESGQTLPFFTRIIMGISNFLLDYGIFLLVAVIITAAILGKFTRSKTGKQSLSRLKISLPYVGNLYQKLYLTRIAGNMNTMLLSGVPIVKVLENTAQVVDNDIYKEILDKAAESVKSGKSISDSLSGNSEIPNIMVQMIKIGEETGDIGSILQTLARFYEREVTNSVNTLVSLIEPAMIVALALGVGILLTSVLIPIYNISSAI